MSASYLLFSGSLLCKSVCSLRSLFLWSKILLKVSRMNSTWSVSLLSSISLDSRVSATISISTCSRSRSSRLSLRSSSATDSSLPLGLLLSQPVDPLLLVSLLFAVFFQASLLLLEFTDSSHWSFLGSPFR